MTEPMAEAVLDGEAPEPSGAHSGEKRPQDVGDVEFVEPQLSKKARNGPELSRDLRRVAEIVLVMSTMAAVRGGKKPSDAEVELMAEARAKLVEICGGLAPKDIVSGGAIGSVIEDLGLYGKGEYQKLGFRGPRLTIAEKFAQAKRKMEESKKYIAASAYGSHPTQTNFTPVESRGSLPSVRMFPSDKSTHIPTSLGGTSPSLPPGHASASGSASIQVQLPSNEARAHVISSGLPTNHQVRDTSSFMHRAERQLNGTYGSQMQVNSSVNNPPASAPTWSAQTQFTLSAKSGPEQKLLNHTGVSAQGTMDSSTSRSTPQAARDQSGKPSISQTVPGNMPSLQSPVQMSFVQAPSRPNNHKEIVKIVQKLLQPQLPDHPTWNPPSRDYMNKTVTCQTCLITINDVDSVLICDACEKGFHFKCVQLQSPTQRAIPRGEWHCPRCLIISNGKPLPPKYGRVMRSNPPPKVSANTGGLQLLENRSGSMDQKVGASQLTFVSDGGSDLQNPQPVDGVSNINNSSGTKISDTVEISGNHFVPINKDIDEKLTSSSSLNIPAQPLGPAHGSSSAELSGERSAHHIKSLESPKGEEASSEEAEPPKVSHEASSGSKVQPPKVSQEASSGSKVEPPKVSQEASSESKAEPPKVSQEASSESKSEPPKVSQEASSESKAEPPKVSQDASSESKAEPSKVSQEASSESKAEPPKVSHTMGDNFNGPEPHNNSQVVDQKIVSNSPEKSQSLRSAHSPSNGKEEDHEILQANNVENCEASITDKEQPETSSDDLRVVECIGDTVLLSGGKAYYKTCCIDGITYKDQDYALFSSTDGKLTPYRLMTVCREFKTGLRWAIAKRCYFPDELPEKVIRPSSPECNEVYTSESHCVLKAGLIRGPCEILPLAKFKAESERRSQLGPGADNGMKQIFLCKWFYDVDNGRLVPFSG